MGNTHDDVTKDQSTSCCTPIPHNKLTFSTDIIPSNSSIPLCPYLQYIDQDHGVGDLAVQFLLLGHVGQVDQSPGYDARSTVEEKFEVKPLPNAWVELNAHHVVIEEVPCELAMESQKRWMQTS